MRLGFPLVKILVKAFCIPEMADEMAAALAAAKSCDMGVDAADEAAPHPPAVFAMGGEGDWELEAADSGEASLAAADCQAVAPARSMVSSERASSPLVE